MSRFLCFVIASLLFACQPKNFPSFVQSEEVALAKPVISIDSVLFRQQARFVFLPIEPESQIRYATNGEEVTLNSPICKGSLIVKEDTGIQFRAFHPDFLPSETLSFSVRKIYADRGMNILNGSTLPKAPYEGNGLEALSDMEKGLLDFRANDAWLGYQEEVIEIHFAFEKPTLCEQIGLSTLVDVDSWIFPPSKVELVFNEMVLAEKIIAAPLENETSSLLFIDLPVGLTINEATLKIYMDVIPDWHAGKGTVPWFFLDEVFY